ncbi:MAG: hypothetical protein DRP03_02670 [Candidatus Aenigmatarchaeota archaeon]|nr:MAG: hypothetical protein DRP03_02670 [Candidatus Aenigmarchaeota archaeon]
MGKGIKKLFIRIINKASVAQLVRATASYVFRESGRSRVQRASLYSSFACSKRPSGEKHEPGNPSGGLYYRISA